MRTILACLGRHYRLPGLFLCGAVLLSGCASQLSARVTQYQQWPADAVGASYYVSIPESSPNKLQQQSYADSIRGAMGATGLVEAANADTARFEVVFDVSSPVEQRWVRREADPYPFGWGINPWFGGFYGHHWGWNAGMMMAPTAVTVPVQVYNNTLRVTIRDKSANRADVFQATAVQVSESNQIDAVLPYLAQAIFDDFPGTNGKVRDVTYDLE